MQNGGKLEVCRLLVTGITVAVTLAVCLSGLRAIYISLQVHNHFLLSELLLSNLSLFLFFPS